MAHLAETTAAADIAVGDAAISGQLPLVTGADAIANGIDGIGFDVSRSPFAPHGSSGTFAFNGVSANASVSNDVGTTVATHGTLSSSRGGTYGGSARERRRHRREELE